MKPLKFIQTLNETEPEMARREYITRNVLFFTFIVTFSFALISFILYLSGRMPLDTLLIYSVESIILVVAMFLAEAGFWRVVGIIPPLLMYLPAVNANYIGGIDAPGNFMYALIIIFVAMIYGYRKIWIALVICLATYLCLAWMISSGYIKPFRTAEVVFVNRVVLTSGFLVGIAFMLWLIGRSYRSEIDVRINAEEMLNRKNEELGLLNTSLRESEELYTKLMATLPDVMVRMDLNGQILNVNDIGLHMSGYTHADLIGQNMLSVIAPEDQERAVRNTILMLERRLGPQEYHLIMKDGRSLPFEVNGDILRNEDGSPYGIVQICRDISERKQTETALIERREELDRFFNLSLDLLCIADADGYFRRLNPEWEVALGYKLEELEGKRFLDFIHPDDLESTLAAMSDLAGGKQVFNFTNRYMAKDGTYRWIEWRSVPYQNKLIYAAARDVTERKQTEEKYRRIFENAQVGIFQSTEEGRFLTANRALANMLGYDSPEDLIITVIDIPKQLYVNPADRKLLMKMIEEQGPARGFETQFYRKNGSILWVSENQHAVRDAGGHVFYYEGFIEDITDRKRAEESLRDSEARSTLIMDNITDRIWLTDMNFKILWASESVLRDRGYQLEEINPFPFEKLIAPNSLEIALKAISEELTPQRLQQKDLDISKTLELEFFRKDGSTFWSEVKMTVLRGHDGTPNSILGVGRDISERKRAEEILRESEEKYRELVENANSIILRMDNVGNVTFINEYAQGFFGYTEDEIFGKNVVGTIVPEIESTGRELRSLIEDIAKNPDSYVNNINENMRSNGERVWIVWTNKPILDEHGRVKEILCIGIDTTDHKRAEEALKESENWYRTIFENTGTATVILDEDTTIILANGEYEKLSGYTKNELEGKKSWTDFVVKEDLDRMIASHKQRRIDKDIAPKSYEFRFRDQKGNIKNVFLTIDMIPDTRRSVASLLDVTERKMVEDALYRSEERFRTIFNSTFQFTGLLTPDGTLIEANQAALDFAGITMEDVVNRPFWEARWWWGDEIRVQQLKKAITRASGGESIRYEVELQGANKTTAIIDFLLTPVFGASGEITLLIPEGRDITEHKRLEEERKRLEERLQRAEKMEALGQLAGGVAHDLNNVLGVLSGYSELLLLETPKGHRSRGHAEKILQSTEKGAAIIDDLLTLARRGVVVSDVINLNGLVSDFIKTPVFESMKDYHPRVTFKTEYDKNLLNIKASPVHLEKTLMNLVSNAAESISGTGEVTIRTESRYLDKPIRGYDEVKEGDYAVLTVSDTGMGIPAENREKIFEPFYTKKTMGKSGTGLGLAIVWGTVKDHNGYIDVQTKVGEGTTFTLYFPVTRVEMIAPQQKEPMERYMGSGESVLVVDDIAEQRDVASRLLTWLGYEVHVVSSGEEAVAYLKGNKADILVLDMIMPPGIDGLEAYRRVLGINPKQKAIIVSGFSETEQVKEAQKLGAGAYVKKPFVMEIIGSAIRDELNR